MTRSTLNVDGVRRYLAARWCLLAVVLAVLHDMLDRLDGAVRRVHVVWNINR